MNRFITHAKIYTLMLRIREKVVLKSETNEEYNLKIKTV